MTLEEVKQELVDCGCEGSVVLENPDYADAFVGVTTDGRAVYDLEKMVVCLMEEDGMSEEDAREFIDYNTLRAIPYMESAGPAPVVLAWRLDV